MKHLFSISAYSFDVDEYGGTHEAIRKIKEAGADGLELFTGYFEPDAAFKGVAAGVHLPYATDWYSAWNGDTEYLNGINDDNIRYRSYGRNREQMADTLHDAIIRASSLNPAYGVLHASNVRMNEIMNFSYNDSDDDVVRGLAELLNSVAKRFPKGEPPFKIVLENLWWPGLAMTDDSGLNILKDVLTFGNWGLCLDTGHLMNRLGNCRDEVPTIKDVLRIAKNYPREMKNKIETIHLHMSLSADYTDECIRNPMQLNSADYNELMTKAYEHACRIDQHRPFTDKMCTDIVRLIEPKYVTHEVFGPTPSERLSGFSKQRSLFR
jgi:sugar phosphate isomerase/epimerase